MNWLLSTRLLTVKVKKTQLGPFFIGFLLIYSSQDSLFPVKLIGIC